MKKKKHLSGRLPALPFILLFALSYALTMGLGNFLALLLFTMPVNISWTLMSPLAIITPILLLGVGQSAVFKYQYGWSARRWLLASFVAVVSIFIYYFSLFSVNFPPPTFAWLLSRVPILILGLAQFLALRRYVKHAWFWIVALLAMTVFNVPMWTVFNRIAVQFTNSFLANTILGTLIGSVEGIILAIVITMLVRLNIRSDRKQFEVESEEDTHTNHLEEHQEQSSAHPHSDLEQHQQYLQNES